MLCRTPCEKVFLVFSSFYYNFLVFLNFYLKLNLPLNWQLAKKNTRLPLNENFGKSEFPNKYYIKINIYAILIKNISSFNVCYVKLQQNTPDYERLQIDKINTEALAFRSDICSPEKRISYFPNMNALRKLSPFRCNRCRCRRCICIRVRFCYRAKVD